MCEVCGSRDRLVYVIEQYVEYWECMACYRTYASEEEVYADQTSESYCQRFEAAEVQAASGFG